MGYLGTVEKPHAVCIPYPAQGYINPMLKLAKLLHFRGFHTVIDWVAGIKEIRLKDMPSFIRTTNLQDFMLDFLQGECERAQKASAIILNTFDALEHDILDAFSSIFPPVYSIGPLNLLLNDVSDNKELKTIGSNHWKEEAECLEWLDTKEPNSVVYVNFGSVTVMTSDQLIEFAWGLANSNNTFFWVIRPDLVAGENAVLPLEFVAETKNRCLLLSCGGVFSY